MSNPLLDIDQDNEHEGGAEEETVHPFHQPYNSYSFAASSWQLRKNLAGTLRYVTFMRKYELFE